MSTIERQYTPGGITDLEAFVTAGRAGRTVITMTAAVTIDAQDLRERLSSVAPPRIIDVRTPGEFETAHIAGAYRLAAAIGGGLALAALTNTCAMGMALSKLPYSRCTTCDAQSVVAQLVGTQS